MLNYNNDNYDDNNNVNYDDNDNDLRRCVPQELVTQLRNRLWSALVIFSFGYLNISDYMKFDIFL